MLAPAESLAVPGISLAWCLMIQRPFTRVPQAGSLEGTLDRATLWSRGEGNSRLQEKQQTENCSLIAVCEG